MKAYSQITFDFADVQEEPSSPQPSVGIRLKSMKPLTPAPAIEPEPVIVTTIEEEIILEPARPVEPEIIQTEVTHIEDVQPIFNVVKSSRGRKSMKTLAAEADLVDVPEDDILFQKQYYTIGEVSTMFRVNPSLLRFWEAEFDIIQPRKNRKGDRHFRPVDIKNLLLIHDLLRRRKLTIEGAKDFLKQNKKSQERFEMIQSLQKIKSFFLELKASL